MCTYLHGREGGMESMGEKGAREEGGREACNVWKLLRLPPSRLPLAMPDQPTSKADCSWGNQQLDKLQCSRMC